jgi:hypothetical protein
MAGLFSFNEIKDISGSSTAIAASENALFSKNTLDNQINELLLLTFKPLVRSIIALHLKKRWLVTKTAY